MAMSYEIWEMGRDGYRRLLVRMLFMIGGVQILS